MMSQLMRSFVSSLHKHVSTEPQDVNESAMCIAHLITVLNTPDTPVDVLEVSLITLSLVFEGECAVFHSLSGLKKLFSFARTHMDKMNLFSTVARHKFATMLLHDPTEFHHTLEQEPLNVLLPILFKWCAHIGNSAPEQMTEFVRILGEHHESKRELCNHRWVAPLMEILNETALRQPLRLWTCMKNVQTYLLLTEDNARSFWSDEGSGILLDVLCRTRLEGRLQSSWLLTFLARHASLYPRVLEHELEDRVVCKHRLVNTLLAEFSTIGGDTVVQTIRVLHVRCIFDMCSTTLFATTFLERIVQLFTVLLTHGRPIHEAFDILVRFGRRKLVQNREGLFRLVDLAGSDVLLSLKASLVLAHALSSHEMIVQFKWLLEVLLSAPCTTSEGTMRSRITELDELLTERFGELCADPKCMFPLMIVGTTTEMVFFHIVDSFLPDHPHTLGRGWYRVTDAVREYLTGCMGALAHPLHPNLQHYCHDLVDKYDLDVDALPPSPPRLCDDVIRCPITLEPMHFPVVASDGNTYELGALVNLRRNDANTFVSPISREDLVDAVVFNRCLLSARPTRSQRRAARRNARAERDAERNAERNARAERDADPPCNVTDVTDGSE